MPEDRTRPSNLNPTNSPCALVALLVNDNCCSNLGVHGTHDVADEGTGTVIYAAQTFTGMIGVVAGSAVVCTHA